MTLKRNFWLLLCAVFAMTLTTSCDDDSVIDPIDPIDTSMPGPYALGTFVINEGPFQVGTGSISYYDKESAILENDVFFTANDPQVLGNIVQSMSIHNDKAYIVVNNAAKVEVVDAGTMVSQNTISGFTQPRYFHAINDDKAYVSEWGEGGLVGAVNVVDLNTNAITNTIATGSGAEQMVQVGNDVYVANSGGFGRDSLLAVIDTNSDQVTSLIYVGDNPNSLVVDKDNAVWVLAGGHTDYQNSDNNTNGALCKLVNNEVISSMIVPNGANDLVINSTGDQLYFSVNGQVLQHGIDDLTLDTNAFIDRSFYGLGVDADGNIWCADAKDYSSNGEIVIYNSDGAILETHEVGVIPNGFLFQ